MPDWDMNGELTYAALKGQCNALAADLAKYGRHLPGCWANDWPVKSCNCGWEEVAVRIGLLAGPTPTFTEADDAIA